MAEVTRVDRRLLELCVITEVMQELQSGDLYIPGSDRYSDYRDQLVSDEECRQVLASYGERSGVPVDAKQFIAKLQGDLQQQARKADEGYPTNEYLTIDKDGAFLKRLRRLPDPEGLRGFLRLLKDRMTPVGIMEVLLDTEDWLNWTKHFGPISGLDSKLENATERYIVTTFCYGFDFGPTQTCGPFGGWTVAKFPF